MEEWKKLYGHLAALYAAAEAISACTVLAGPLAACEHRTQRVPALPAVYSGRHDHHPDGSPPVPHTAADSRPRRVVIAM